MAARLVGGERLLGVAAGGREIAGEELGVGERAAGDQHQPRIVCASARRSMSPATARHCSSSARATRWIQRPNSASDLLRSVAHLPAELPGALVGLPGFLGREAPRRDQRRAEADLQADLGAVAMRTLLELGQRLQRAREMGDRLLGRRARHRQLARLAPELDRLLVETAFGAVMGDQLGVVLQHLGEVGREGARDAGVELLAPLAQHRPVGGLLHQGA